jgi:predicted molibdopterin-dependent oxidoreductase YjgC
VATLDSERSMDGFSMSRLDRFGTQFDRWGRGTRRDARPTWKIISGIASLMGRRFRYASSDEVFAEMATTVGAFKGMSYLRLGKKGLPLKTDVAAGIHA